jgi:peroxiredoxin
MATPLQPGQAAPPFALPATPDQKVSLSDFKDTQLVLMFYPADWSPVCSDELAVFNELLPQFRERGATLVGVSVDGPWCHTAFARARHLHFPLLSDFEPKGAVAKAYGVYRDGEGVCERALFVIDGGHTVRWSHVSPVGVNPGADGVLDYLDTARCAARRSPS